MLKVLSWNIQAGGGSRLARIYTAVRLHNADIIILSEFRNGNSGILIRSNLLKMGYRHQAVTQAATNENSVLLASKIPLEAQNHSGSDPNYSNNIISGHFSVFNVMGVYLPHKKKNSLLPYINKIFSESEQPYILAGDYNTGKNYVDQKGNSFWYTDQLDILESLGYVDAFRQLHGDAKEYSWYSHQGNGFRYDHTYIHQSLLPIVKGCYYDHRVRLDKVSDHSAMILELG